MTFKNRLLFLLCAGIILLSLGCGGSKDLSRSKAAQIIKETYNKETKNSKEWRVNTLKFEKHEQDEYFVIPGGADPKILDAYKKLTDHGLVVMGKITIGKGSGQYNYDAMKFTNKAKPYIISEDKFDGIGGRNDRVIILLAEVDNVEVTGIAPVTVEGAKMSEVEFTLHYKPTPIGELLLKPDKLIEKSRLPFKLYDDGWRIGL